MSPPPNRSQPVTVVTRTQRVAPKPRRPRRRNRTNTSSTSVTTTTEASRRQRKRNGNSGMLSTMQPSLLPGANQQLRCYINTLSDPFSYGPCRIGFGTMVSTNLATAYVRQTVTAASDGSIAFVLAPQCANMLYYNTSGYATTTWGAVSCNNAAAVQAQMAEGRVVSGGLRVIPQVPGTSAPGVAYAGVFPSFTTNQINAATPSLLAASPLMKIGYAASGASGVILPVDPSSFTFSSATLGSYTATGLFTTSAISIVMTGLPAGTTVLFEAVLNLEGTMGDNTNGAISNPGQATDSPSLSDYFPSLDTVWSTAKRFLPSGATVNDGWAAAARVAYTGARIYSQRQNRQNYFTRLPGANRIVVDEVD